jgi:fibro-slime domain-containing protein
MLCGPGGDPNTAISNSGTITGVKGALSSTVAMPTIAAPPNAVVGPTTGAAWYQNGQVVTISSNKHWDSLRISGTGTRMIISGSVTILVEGVMRTETGGSIVVPTGSSLDLYVKGYATIETACQWSNPVNTRLYLMGTSASTIQTNSSFCGTIVAPTSQLVMKTDAHLYGSFIGKSLQAETGAGLHVDNAGSGLAGCGGPPPSCLVVNDTAGAKGANSNGAITSPATYNTWFADTLGTNVAMPETIFLADVGSGVYEYTSNAFHPIDGLLLGNEGLAHNQDFTYSFLARFTYDSCAGQYFQFDGDDDAWVFINGGLAMDLGGIACGAAQTINLDRLGLTDGQEYDFLFLFAQRQDNQARFHIRTNLVLTTESQAVAISAGYD